MAECFTALNGRKTHNLIRNVCIYASRFSCFCGHTVYVLSGCSHWCVRLCLDYIAASRSQEDDVHNVQSVIDSLSLDYLQISLSHITGMHTCFIHLNPLEMGENIKALHFGLHSPILRLYTVLGYVETQEQYSLPFFLK